MYRTWNIAENEIYENIFNFVRYILTTLREDFFYI